MRVLLTNHLGLGGDSEDSDTKEKDDEAERERLEAIKEAEERRKDKHRKMEEEREKMRQDIRDKVYTSSHCILHQMVVYPIPTSIKALTPIHFQVLHSTNATWILLLCM